MSARDRRRGTTPPPGPYRVEMWRIVSHGGAPAVEGRLSLDGCRAFLGFDWDRTETRSDRMDILMRTVIVRPARA